MLELHTRPQQHAPDCPVQAGAIPAVSVVMDVSDGDRYLDAALESLAGQSFEDFEIVLCAHGVTERTREIIVGWLAREPRLRVLWHERMSLSRAHNAAARAACAPLLARLDADDIAMPHRLERQVRMFREQPNLCLLGSAVELINVRGRSFSQVENPLSDTAIRAAIADSCPIVHSTVMMRTDSFWRVGGYREGLNTSEDYDLYARMLEGAPVGNCPEALVRYRVHSDSLTSSRPLRMAITNLIVQTAIVARARGEREPFAGGFLSLRRAQAILCLDRDELRLRLGAMAWQAHLSRAILMIPAPLRVNATLRRLALRLGLRPIYSGGIRVVASAIQRVRQGGAGRRIFGR